MRGFARGIECNGLAPKLQGVVGAEKLFQEGGVGRMHGGILGQRGDGCIDVNLRVLGIGMLEIQTNQRGAAIR